MNIVELNTEIEKVEKITKSLLACVQDMNISGTGRKQYYTDYLESANYLLKLKSEKNKRNLRIV